MASQIVTTTDLPLPKFSVGKVRDTYDLGDRLLMVATDRISAFDCILPNGIPDKGRVLTQLSAFWFGRLAGLIANHLISVNVDDLPAALRDDRDLRELLDGRFMIVQKAKRLDFECVVRGYLAGSGWADYQATGAVCGVTLPAGLRQGDRLPHPIFTPATKAAIGEHDVNVTFDEVVGMVGQEEAQELKRLTMLVYERAAALARERGLVLADTKFEFGRPTTGPNRHRMILADEVLTPDSSRYWPATEWQPGQAQASFDKQFVRDWLTSPDSGWRKDSGDPPPALPDEVVAKTRAKYIEAYEYLTGERFR